jgi:TonB family protein
MKTYHLFALLLLVSTFSFAQVKRPSINDDLPINVIDDFSKAVNYAWKYANNKAAFKGALIPYLQQRGVYSTFEIEKAIQNVGKSKSSRNLVLGALADYTGIGRLNQILLNMSIPANSARVLTSYAYVLQQQSTDNNTTWASHENSKSEYIVTAQKTYLYNSDANKSVGKKSSTFLVEGDKFVAQRQKGAYIFCEFIDPLTKKKTTGWLSRTDVEKLSDDPSEPQVNNIDANSPFYQLKRYDGEHEDIKKVFADPTIEKITKSIIGADYPTFYKNFLSSNITGSACMRHGVLYIESFVIHHATTNASFFIDLNSGESRLYWNTYDKTYNDLVKVYGDFPLPFNILKFIQYYKVAMRDIIDENKSQNLDNILNYHDPNEIFNAADADVYPEFPKGSEAFYKFLGNNLKYPLLAKQNKIAGIVNVQFVVEKDGTLTDIKIIKGLGNGCDEEVVRVMKLSPPWQPAKRGGEYVRARYIAPITFNLTDD